MSDSTAPPRVLFLVSLSLGFLCALAWVLWESVEVPPGRSSEDGSATSERGSDDARPIAIDGRFEITDEDRRLYAPKALRRDPTLERVDPESHFRERELPWIQESTRFEQSRLGLGLGVRGDEKAEDEGSPRTARGQG